jgi:SAM-dependent methyltransferase
MEGIPMRSCRFCNHDTLHEILDLHHQPPSNSFLTQEQLREPEVTYPLKLYVCSSCWLVQVDECKKAEEIFSQDYPYYSSQSPSNVQHAKEYVEMIVGRFRLGMDSKVLEIGSNDGYLLKHFIDKRCMVMGCDPSEGPANKAMLNGIPTMMKFFGMDTVGLFPKADLICNINTLAHQPHLNDFVEAMKTVLAPDGIITCEFPHLMRLMDECQFDTIYHEHYSYFSFGTVCEIFRRHKLVVFDVDEIPEHGGSLRIYARHEISQCDDYSGKITSENNRRFGLLRQERQLRGMNTINYYLSFQNRVDQIKRDLVSFLIDMRSEDKMVIGYGAPAKGNTLLNFCGIGRDLVEFTVDRSPHKQGKYLPGSHIPVYDEQEIRNYEPEYVLILPWNLKKEIMEQLKYIREWGGKFVVAIPELEVL